MRKVPDEYLFVEPPSSNAKIDFGGLCTVRLEVEMGDPPMLRVYVVGCDDRSSILIDQTVEIPPAVAEDSA